MWLWQRKKTQKRRQKLWLKLFCLCLLFHIFLLGICFFCSDSSNITLKLSKNKEYNVPISFVPFFSVSSSGVAEEKIVSSGCPPPKENKKLVIAKAVNSFIVAAKVIEKKEEKIEQEVPVKQKTVENKTASDQKTAEKISTIPTQENKKLAIPTENISHDYRQVEDMRRMILLQKELSSNWAPPIGVSADAMCDIEITINCSGQVTNSMIVKKSGNIMYDISARNSVLKIKMPLWTWGKKVTITFKQ